MKTSKGYRFSLRWGAQTVEKVQAGEFLEGLGHKKSDFVVLAVAEYLEAHPEARAASKHMIVMKPNYTKQHIQEIVQSYLERKLSEHIVISQNADEHRVIPLVTEDDVEEMLKNLDLFS